MAHQFSKLMFNDTIKNLQERYGSRRQYERMAEMGPENDTLTQDEADFIAARDSFYIASQGENGWPYVQHRGGPKGFLKVIDEKTLAFADYSGNKQYVTTGNLLDNDKVTLFLMDYPHQTRLKILGHAEIVETDADPALLKQVLPTDPKAKIDRMLKIHVVAFDWNCPQHIVPRYTKEEIEEAFARSAHAG